MKIATYNDGSRDGQLLVVSRDLSLAHYATGIAGHLQQLLDDWNFLSPQLEELSQTLNHGKARHAFAFDPARCLAPLPRAHCVALVDPPIASREQPLPVVTVVRGDALRGPRDGMPLARRSADAGEPTAQPAEYDFFAQPALITGDLAAGCAADEALASIRLMMLASSWHPADPDHRLGVRPWGCLAFAPVAVTPEELGAGWNGGRIELALDVQRGSKRFGRCPTAGEDGWSIGEVLAACAGHGGLRSGSIVGVGMPATDGSVGDCSIAWRRRRETELDGGARTPWLDAGEKLRIEAIGRDGDSVFGAIEPAPAPAAEPATATAPASSPVPAPADPS